MGQLPVVEVPLEPLSKVRVVFTVELVDEEVVPEEVVFVAWGLILTSLEFPLSSLPM